MWSLLRIVIISLAFVGFLGQTEARATSFSVTFSAQAMPDCAEMAMGATDATPSPKQMPCHDMTPDCIAKMGCATVSPVFAVESAFDHPVSGRSPSYGGVSSRLAGLTTTPPRDPPRP